MIVHWHVSLFLLLNKYHTSRPLTEITHMNRGLKAQLKVFIVGISRIKTNYSCFILLAGFFSIYNRSRDGCGIYKISSKGGRSLRLNHENDHSLFKRCCEIILEQFLICVI